MEFGNQIHAEDGQQDQGCPQVTYVITHISIQLIASYPAQYRSIGGEKAHGHREKKHPKDSPEPLIE